MVVVLDVVVVLQVDVVLVVVMVDLNCVALRVVDCCVASLRDDDALLVVVVVIGQIQIHRIRLMGKT